jgi:transposase-like protein
MSHEQTTTEQQQQQQHKDLATGIPDPEVVPKAKRRQFTAKYKLRIVREADACTEPGQIGSLLRREGLYSSYLTKWRQQREDGQLQALSSKKRGRKPEDPSVEELAQLQRENKRCNARSGRTRVLISTMPCPPATMLAKASSSLSIGRWSMTFCRMCTCCSTGFQRRFCRMSTPITARLARLENSV